MTQEHKTRGRPPTIAEDVILDAARDVFLERGNDATTVEIAERAGVSESILFYRYKTREALFMAVCDRECEPPPLLDSLAARAGTGVIADHLHELGDAMLAIAEASIPFLMMAWSSPTKMALLRERMKRPHPLRVKMMRQLAAYFEAESRLGRLREVDPEILARTYLGAIGDYVMTKHMHGTADSMPLPARMFLRGLVDIILKGAEKPQPAAPRAGKRGGRG